MLKTNKIKDEVSYNFSFTLATPEIKHASSASVQFLRLRLLLVEESDSKAVSASESIDLAVLVLERRTCNFLGLGV